MPRPYLHVKTPTLRATRANFHKMEWGMAISWQLQGLRPALFFAKIILRGSYGTAFRLGLTAVLLVYTLLHYISK